MYGEPLLSCPDAVLFAGPLDEFRDGTLPAFSSSLAAPQDIDPDPERIEGWVPELHAPPPCDKGGAPIKALPATAAPLRPMLGGLAALLPRFRLPDCRLLGPPTAH
mmetsp:Transcript_21712/g.39858  ORF Transcript_21712/g.39858 Transcript_21712/m.39858 type:complete len:106 (-) Transcript_21712:115-432(-)